MRMHVKRSRHLSYFAKHLRSTELSAFVDGSFGQHSQKVKSRACPSGRGRVAEEQSLCLSRGGKRGSLPEGGKALGVEGSDD